jgi:hypothetical protein
MKAEGVSETSVHIYQTRMRQIPENESSCGHCCENPKC